MGDSLPEAATSLLEDSKDDASGYFRIGTIGSVFSDSLPFLDVFAFHSAWIKRCYSSSIQFLTTNRLPMAFS